jgi:hypothetical protein
VRIGWKSSGGWDVEGGVSGKLIFRPPSAGFGEGAESWLGHLFESVAVEFDHLALSDLTNSAKLLDGLSLQLRLAEAIDINFWELLRLQLDSIKLRAGGISIGGNITIEFPGIELEGRLPDLGIRLDRGHVSLGIGDLLPAEFHIRGEITIPSGVKASVEVRRIRRADEEGLFGAGTLTIPGLPGLRIAAELGRWIPKGESAWRPLFFFYVEADIPVIVFPGIVLRQEGVGVGIDKALAGFSDLIADPEKGAQKLTDGKTPIPDPGTYEGWENREGQMVALRTHVTASQAPADTVQPYVLDIVLGISSDLSIVAFTGGWLFTKLDSTRDPGFRTHPIVRGVIGLFPRQPRLEARFRTVPGSKSDIQVPVISQLLDVIQAQVSVVATPDLFELKLGPITGDAHFLGLSVHAEAMTVVHVGKGAALMMSRFAMNASLSAGVGFTVGPLSVSVSLAARFAYECTYLGGFEDNDLLLYGDTRISAAASLHVDLDLHIHIELFFGDIDIHIHFAASLTICFDASVQAVVSNHGAGIRGSGSLALELFGFRLGFSVPFALGNIGQLDRARLYAQHLALTS